MYLYEFLGQLYLDTNIYNLFVNIYKYLYIFINIYDRYKYI